MAGPLLFVAYNASSLMEGVSIMFDKLRYSYHLTACERMIKKYNYIDHSTYELNRRFKWHRKRLNDLMITVNRRKKRV